MTSSKQVILLEYLGTNPEHAATLDRLFTQHVDLAAERSTNNPQSAYYAKKHPKTARGHVIAPVALQQPTPREVEAYKVRNRIDYRFYRWAIATFVGKDHAPRADLVDNPQPASLGAPGGAPAQPITGFGDVGADGCGGHGSVAGEPGGAWRAGGGGTSQFVMSVNAGHVGSTTIGSKTPYAFVDRNAPGVYAGDAACVIFEGAGHAAPTRDFPTQKKGQGVSGWAWLARENSLAAPAPAEPACLFARSADVFVRQYLDKWAPPPGLPACPTQGNPKLKVLGTAPGVCSCDRDKTKIRIDLGHHMLFGLGDALVRQIGVGRLAVVRIRRSKFSNALSYYSEGKIPCNGIGKFVLCPWHHGSVLLPRGGDNSSQKKWDQLTDWDRCLWLVDEVEARWTAFRAAHPDLAVIETNWSNGTELTAAIGTVAAFLQERLRLADPDMQGVKVVPKPQKIVNTRHHVDHGDPKVAAMVAGLTTRHYEEAMAFTPHQLAMIVKQQF